MQLLNLLIFFILSFLIFYLPGRSLLRRTGNNFESYSITLSASLVIGISLFLFVTYLLEWLNIGVLYNFIIPIGLIFEGKKTFLELRGSFKKIISAETILIATGSLLMTYLTWNSGVIKSGELVFFASGDSIYHLALIGSLVNNFPPFHPGLSGVYLRGYNFFYDFLISSFTKFYNLSIYDLFFRDFSLLISILFGTSALALARFMKFKKNTTILFLFLIFFAQSFDFYAEKIYRFFNQYYNSAGITQSIINIIDPSIILSVGFIFVVFILLFSQKNKYSFVILSLLIGVIPQIKIYAGILFYLGLFSVSVFTLIKNKELSYFKLLFLSGVISAIVYLPINYGAGGLVFAPLVIYKNYIDSAWIFNNMHWNVNFIIYLEHKNYIHIAYFYFVAIFIFLATSLGVRIVTFFDFKKIFSKNFYTSQNIFLASSILTSFLIPSFFVQTVSTFSVIQFFWIGYILMIIPASKALGNRLEDMKTKYKIVLGIILCILFLPGLFQTLKSFSQNPYIINADLIRQAKIAHNLPKDKQIMILDRVKYKNKFVDAGNVPVFSALSGRSVYYDAELTEFQGLDHIYYVRRTYIDKIMDNLVNCSNPKVSEYNIIKIMKETNNDYLLVLDKNTCTSEFRDLKIVDEGMKSVLFKI